MKLGMLGVFALALALALAVAASPAVAFLAGSGGGASSSSMPDEEFVGPFPSWTNVKTSCGAVGDGSHDDTTNIQTCLTGITPTHPCVWFPATPGAYYKIIGTLTLTHVLYPCLIGADPATTTIKWAGAGGGTMLRLNGTQNGVYSRLTFDGSGTAGYAIDSSWDAGGAAADHGNQFSDLIIENSAIGIRCGGGGVQCSEHTYLRNKFLNNTTAGFSIEGGGNALDTWFWYNRFQNNGAGLTNKAGLGIFEVYNSNFIGNGPGCSTAFCGDAVWGNTGFWVFRNNYSIGSYRFVNAGGTCANDPTVLQNNIILDTVDHQAVFLADPGPLILLDNTIRQSVANAASGPAFGVGNCIGDSFSMGNTYTVASSANHSFQDSVVNRSSVNPSEPTLPGTPPNIGRTIYEAANYAQIVSGIASAGASCDNSVIHIQPGTINVTSMIVVPANCAMQLIGDGWYSTLNWGGLPGGPVLRLAAPSKAVLRNFAVNGGTTADGIEIHTGDIAGGGVFADQLELFGWSGSHANLLVDALNNTIVEIRDANTVYPPAGQIGVLVVGGSSPAGARTNIFTGSSAGNGTGYGASNGGRLAVRANFTDSGAGGVVNVTATGPSAITLLGSTLNSLPSTVIDLPNFTGTAGLIGDYVYQNISITGNATGAQILGLGLVLPTSGSWVNTATGSPTIELLNSQTPAPAHITEIGCCDPITFLPTTLAQTREQPALPSALPPGPRLYDLAVSNSIIDIHIEN